MSAVPHAALGALALVLAATAQPAAAGPLVYIEVDGITLTRSQTTDDARTGQSVMVDSDTEVIPRFDEADLASRPGLSRNELIDELIRLLYLIHAPYDVDFTATRPTGGAYSMVVIGGDCATVAGMACTGIAPRDCGDANPANIAFVFPRGLTLEQVATLAAHESAHAWGLGHTDDPDDVMNPFIGDPPQTSYGAGNLAGRNGQPDGSGCPASATYQDSHELLLANIGPRPPDTAAPEVRFDSVRAGQLVRSGQRIRLDSRDNVATTRIELEVDGAVIGTADRAPHAIALPADLAAGALRLTARAVDVAGNDGVATVEVWVSNEPPRPCATAADCGAGERCEETGLCVPGGSSTDLFADCRTDGDCWTGSCARSGELSLCTLRCDGDDDCPGDARCLDGTACWPADQLPDPPGDGGCQSGAPGSAFTALLLLLAALRFRLA